MPPRRASSAISSFGTRSAAKARTVSRSWRCVSLSSTRTSASLPRRRPLVEERLQALDAILGGEGHGEGLDLVAAAGLQGRVGGDRRGALRLGERDRRLGGEVGGQM